jgi:hypothetical protein
MYETGQAHQGKEWTAAQVRGRFEQEKAANATKDQNRIEQCDPRESIEFGIPEVELLHDRSLKDTFLRWP